MTPPKGSAAYKKKDGTLSMSKDRQSVSWTPVTPPGAPAGLILSVPSITNLQQTPANNPKVMLKIFAQLPATSTPEAHVFSFTSATAARAEADAIKDALTTSISAAKSASEAAAAAGSGSSAAMAIASAISSGAGGGRNTWDDDIRLKSDVGLQRSLLEADPALQKTFMESLRTKPESISNSQFSSQFWSTRVNLLRAHAIEKSQTRGSYNVLSTLKPRTEGNDTKLNISGEQIQFIFRQHPLAKRAYDENVPKLSEKEFWSRFIQSRLFKKLKGENVDPRTDATDAVLDKYANEEFQRTKPIEGIHVPHFIDLEGNEVNHSQRKGNKPDWTMRPGYQDKRLIIQTLNNLSETIMDQVAPNDVDPSEPIGMDEETFNELQLRDLQGDPEQNRIILNIRDQSRFFSDTKDAQITDESSLYAKQDTTRTLRELQSDLGRRFPDGGTPPIELDLEDSGNEEDDDLGKATAQIFEAIRQRRSQDAPEGTQAAGGLSTAIFDRVTLTHATTTEFLHQFWLAFLSGDPERANEIAALFDSLNRAMDRIKAVADDAEVERDKEIENRKQRAREYYKRTERRVKPNLDGIGGGKKVVNQLLGPTMRALGVATIEYQKALQAEQ